MKVVLDTNVLVSAVLTPRGPCSRIVELIIDGFLQPCMDGRIFEEYRQGLHRPELALPTAEIDEILDLIRRSGDRVSAPPWPTTLPDPDDLPFLETAAAAGALLVTGNQRHFPKRQREGVVVVGPAELLDLLREARL